MMYAEVSPSGSPVVVCLYGYTNQQFTFQTTTAQDKWTADSGID